MDAGWDTFAADVVRWNLQKSRGRLRREAEARAAAQAAARQAANVDAHPRKKRKKERHRREPVNPEAPVGSHERWVDDPTQSNWWKLMQRRGVRVLGTRAYHKFRNKFRLPLVEVEKLVSKAQATHAEWRDKPSGVGHGRGHGRHPFIMKVLCALRCLAKGCDVDTIEDAAHIKASTLQAFVPRFIRYLSEEVYPQEVRLPTGAHLDASLKVFERLGYPGAYCNTDGVHVAWDQCPHQHFSIYTGKEGYPSVAFNVSVLQSTEMDRL